MIDSALYARWQQVADQLDRPERPEFATPLSYSRAGNCSRALSYKVMGADSEPMDTAGVVITDIGNLRHAQIQDLVMALDPTVEIEVASVIGPWWGYADIVYFKDGKPESIDELKTVGTYKRDKLAGIKGYKRQRPEEPSRNNVLQLGLQMMAMGVEWGNLVYLFNEPFSKGVAEALGLMDIERVVKVFRIELADIQREVDVEIARGEHVIASAEEGRLMPRRWTDDNGREVTLDPSRASFPCSYCAYRETCIKDGGP